MSRRKTKTPLMKKLGKPKHARGYLKHSVYDRQQAEEQQRLAHHEQMMRAPVTTATLKRHLEAVDPPQASSGTLVVRTGADEANDFVTEDDFLRLDDSEDMRELLQASGLSDFLRSRQHGGAAGFAGSSSSGSNPASSSLPGRASLRNMVPSIPASQLAAARFINYHPRTTLWVTQQETVAFVELQEKERALGVGGGLVCDEMGMGKTLPFLCVIMQHLQRLCKLTGSPYGQPTLVVVPKTLLSSWRAEIKRHFPGGVFHVLVLAENENTEVTAARIMAQSTLVFTTYPVIVSAFKARSPSAKRMSPYKCLFDVVWWRIVADEGHFFANPETVRFAAMCDLRAHHKWIVTGTPVLNDAGDACAELRFIGIDVAQLPSEQSARSERVSGTIAADRSEEKRGQESFVRYSFGYLMQVRALLECIMLRRMDGRDRYKRTVKLVDFETRAERDVYDLYYNRFSANCIAIRRLKQLQQQGAAGMEENEEEDEEEEEEEDDATLGLELEEGEVYERPAKRARVEKKAAADVPAQRPMQQAMNTLTVDILRMRQLCVEPVIIGTLQLPPWVLLEQGYAAAQRREANTQARIMEHAPRSFPSLTYLAAARVATDVIPPNHFMEAPGGAWCADNPYLAWIHAQLGEAYWRTMVTSGLSMHRLSEVLKHVYQRVLPSIGTKVRMFMRHFRDDIPATDKYLVFSDWVQALLAMQNAFSYLGVGTSMLTGKQTSIERDRVLRDFECVVGQRVLFISLLVGSNGLNVASANHVSLADPWWNPQTQQQAIFRMIRPDQVKYGHVFDIIMRNTVEEDVDRMAKEKQWIARILLDKDEDTLAMIASVRRRLGVEGPPLEQGPRLHTDAMLPVDEAPHDEDEGTAISAMRTAFKRRTTQHSARGTILQLMENTMTADRQQ